MIVYTMAPEAADYEYSKTLETFEVKVFRDQPWVFRKVEIQTDEFRTLYQCARYRSFLGGTPWLDDPREIPLGEGRPAPVEF